MIAVDLGAAATKVAWCKGNGDVSLVTYKGLGEFPTAIFVEPGGELIVADAESYAGTGRVITRLKHLVHGPGESSPSGRTITVGDQGPVDLVDLVGAIMDYALLGLPEGRDKRSERIVLTHPVSWGDRERHLLALGVELTGRLNPISFVTEPEAVAAFALAHGLADFEDGAVAIFDLGACTLDVAVVDRSDHESMDVLASRGLVGGGADFDLDLLDLVEDILRDEDKEDGAAGLAALRESHVNPEIEARSCKERLTELDACTFALELPSQGDRVTPASIDVEISTEDFLERIAWRVARYLVTFEECLTSVHRPVGTIIASGGSIAAPYVREEVARAARDYGAKFVALGEVAQEKPHKAGQCVAPGAVQLVRAQRAAEGRERKRLEEEERRREARRRARERERETLKSVQFFQGLTEKTARISRRELRIERHGSHERSIDRFDVDRIVVGGLPLLMLGSVSLLLDSGRSYRLSGLTQSEVDTFREWHDGEL
jgi:molecular chaperone DnaK (HSP70)